MAKLFITAAILSVFCAISVRGMDKNEAIGDFVAKMEACKEEVGAQDSDLKELFNTSPPSTKEGKCLRSCIMKKYEVMNDDGKLNKDSILAHFETFDDVSEEKKEIAYEILDKCSAIEVSEDHCEAAEEYGKCFKEEAMASDLSKDFDF